MFILKPFLKTYINDILAFEDFHFLTHRVPIHLPYLRGFAIFDLANHLRGLNSYLVVEEEVEDMS